MNSRSPRLEHHPERALPTLPWVAALLVLVVNDHVLKGAGLLPNVVTGKLSDFAGLLVAPVLLATLIRARSTRALIACHVAVGLVFTGIQLSLPFADLWSATMGLVGHPWTITSDPTDLIALPMLLVSWRVLVPAMTRELGSLRVELRQLGVAGLSAVGLWSSVATSDIDSGTNSDEWYEDVYGNLFINNANEHDIAVLVRPLRTDIQFNCLEIAADPGRLLPTQAFGEAVHWLLPARTNVGLSGGGECSAAWVTGEGVPPTIFFWWNVEYPATWSAGQIFAGAGLPVNTTSLVFDEVGASWTGGDAFRFAIDATIPEQPDSCQSVSDERIDWDAAMPRDRPLELLAISHGPDGCFELEVADLWWYEGSVTSYVCAPESALPFAIGDHIMISEAAPGGTSRSLTVHRLDPISNQIVIAVDGEPELRVDLLRGVSVLSHLQSLISTHPVTPISRPTCEWSVDDACAADERPFDLAVAGVEGTLAAGDPTVVLADPIGGGDSVRERELTLVHAQERALVDPICIDGATSLGFDLDAVVVSHVAP